MQLHEKLAKLRAGTNLSRKTVGEHSCGVSEATVRRWEEGRGVPDLYEAAALARLYHVPLGYLSDDAISEPEDMAPSLGLSADDEVILRIARKLGPELAIERLSLVPQGAAAVKLSTTPSEPHRSR